MSQDLVTSKLYSKHIEPVKPSARSPGQSICVERSCINLILHFGATSCSQLCSGTQQSDDLVSGESPQSPASVFSPGALQSCQLRAAQPQSTGRQTSRQNIHGSFTAKSKQKHYFSPKFCVGEHAGNWATASTVRVTVAQSIKLNLLDGKPFNCLFISVVAPSSVPTLTQLCKVHREKLYSTLFNLMTSSHEAATRTWNVTD